MDKVRERERETEWKTGGRDRDLTKESQQRREWNLEERREGAAYFKFHHILFINKYIK